MNDFPCARGLSSLLLLFLALLGPASAPGQQSDPRRPAAVVTEQVPLVPPQVFARLRQYSHVRGARFSGWAPAGDGMLVSTRFGNASQLHRVYEPGGRREQLTFYDEPARGGFIPQAQDNAILFSISRGGDENDQIHLLDPREYRSVRLTDGKSRNRIGAIRDDGRHMIIASNRRNGRDTDLYLADPRQAGSMEMLFQTDGEYWYSADWSPDGATLLLVRYVSINESYFALLDVASRTRIDLQLPGSAAAAIGEVQFAADGRSLYLTTDATGEYRRLARYHPATAEYEWLTNDLDWDVSEVAVDRHSGRVAFSINADGASQLFLLEDRQRRALTIPLGILAGIEFSPDGLHLGFSLSRPDAPIDAYSLDLSRDRLTRWTYSEVGGLDPDRFVAPLRIQFRSFDGRMIPAYYFRPPLATADEPAAVLINIHGGPESQYRPFFSSATQYYLNELGLAVVCPNVRGSAGYGKSYLKLDNGQRREQSVQDIGGLLDWIAAQPELDASRVAVAGGSYGGYMVLAALTHFGDRIKAGIDLVGIANFVTFLENTAPYRQDLRRAEYGDERDPKMRAFFERINPTANADKIESALLVAHGKNDPRVPFSEAVQIADKVRARGRTVWTVYAENEGHGFAKKDNADYLRAVQTVFLTEQLGLVAPAGERDSGDE